MIERNQSIDKADVRKQMAQKRNSLSTEERKLKSEAACEKAKVLLDNLSIKTFMVYIPFRSELDLSALIEWGWQTSRDVIVPRCVYDDRSMTLHLLRSWDELIPGTYGIMEPNPLLTPTINIELVPEIVFVPGLAFDKNGGRLGYGAGYYDRFATTLLERSDTDPSLRTLWIGTAFEEQVIDKVPMEDHDLPLDGILTEQGVYMI